MRGMRERAQKFGVFQFSDRLHPSMMLFRLARPPQRANRKGVFVAAQIQDTSFRGRMSLAHCLIKLPTQQNLSGRGSRGKARRRIIRVGDRGEIDHASRRYIYDACEAGIDRRSNRRERLVSAAITDRLRQRERISPLCADESSHRGCRE